MLTDDHGVHGATLITAFKRHHIADGLGSNKISCVCDWQDKVLVALTTGPVLCYDGKQEDGEWNWHVDQSYKLPNTRKCATQMQCMSNGQFVIALSDEGVSVYGMPGLSLLAQAPRSRGATCFAWDDDRAVLAVATRRRMFVYRFNGKDLLDLKDWPAGEVLQCMRWIGTNLLVASKKQYGMVDVTSGSTAEVCVVGKDATPHITPLHAALDAASTACHEAMLLRDQVSLFVGGDGRVSRKAHIMWSAAPHAVAYSPPHAIALTPSFIEVRCVDRASQHGILQSIAGSEFTIVAPCVRRDGGVLVASKSKGIVALLLPTPMTSQAEAMAAMHEWQDALALASYIPNDQADERRAVEDAVRLRYGMALFGGGEYDEGMAQIGMCSAPNALVLLRLFPSLLPHSIAADAAACIADENIPDIEEPQGEAFEKAVTMLLPYLFSHRNRLLAALQHGQHAASDDDDDAVDDVSHGNDEQGSEQQGAAAQQQLLRVIDTAIVKVLLAVPSAGSLLGFLQRANWTDLHEGIAALQNNGLYVEMCELYKRAGEHDKALSLLHVLSSNPDELAVPPHGSAQELRGLTGVWAAIRYISELSNKDFAVIDKHARWVMEGDGDAFVQALLAMQPPLPPPSVLSLLRSCTAAARILYLEQALQSGIAQHADHDATLARLYLESILNTIPPSPTTKPSTANKASSKSAGAVANGDVAHTAYASSSKARRGNGAAVQQSDVSGMLRKLKELIVASQHVDAHALLSMLPNNHSTLLDVKALLLERLGDHSEALRIYVHDLRDTQQAEQYCDRVYEAMLRDGGSSGSLALSPQLDAAPENIYIMLLHTVLQSGTACGADRMDNGHTTPHDVAWQEIARLLSRKRDRLDPMKVLSMLPEDLTLQQVMAYVEGVLHSFSEGRRNLAVAASLQRAQNMSVWESLLQAKKHWVVVSPERACALCYRRIGTSVFVGTLDDVLMHYSCYCRQSDPSSSAPDEDR